MKLPTIFRSGALAVSLLALASCGGIPTKTFKIDAIDETGKSVKCLVVLDYKWPSKDATDAIYTPATVKVPFSRKQVRVQVKPATVGPDGGIAGVPQQTDPSEYQMAERDIERRDPTKQLFILTR